MDSNVGLDYIVDNPDYCSKLASALDTACTSMKKRVVNLLSALCVYSQDARQRAIDTLHIYQDRKKERYRLRLVVDELQKETEEDYQTALLAFINCLVISAPALKDRVRIRNEFIGLKLLPVLSDLRKRKNHVPDLRVQLDVFDDQRETDEALSNQGPLNIDLSSHVDVFYAILGQVADTPQEIPFLSILQHLLRLDPKEAASDLAWDTAETLVHRATLIENREDATKLLRSPSLQTNLCCHCRGTDQSSGTGRKSSMPTSTSIQLAPPPPPPAPPIPAAPPTFPPPPPPLIFPCIPPVPPIPNVPSEPPVPPSLTVPVVIRSPTPELPSQKAKLLPQQEIPTPKAKMKTINWNKIPNHKVVGKRNIWSLVANDHENSPMADIDWAEMEGLFCQQAPPVAQVSTCPNTSNLNNDSEKRRREPTEISLLHGKRSLNVNIFLKQFRSSNEDIIQLIKDGGHDDIGAEKLRGLLKILPELDELEMLKSFDGDKSKLGNAEKFFLQLAQVSNYKLRIECMLLKEEFAANMSYLEPSINSMILAGEDLMINKPLQEVLYMVLVAGNFLNSGGYAGNAAGVKLSSLQKLTEIRANKPGMNLIHYVALQAERKRKDLLNFARNMTILDSSTKTTVEQLTNEFNCLDTKIKKIKSQIQLSSTEAEIQEQMAQFLQVAEQGMTQLKRDMEELENVRKSLAEFFCEDVNTFKIEECFKIFHQFCQKFNQAVAENERRRVQEEQALARRKQREEQLLVKKRLLTNQMDLPGSESDNNLMDCGIFDLNSGFNQKQYGRNDTKIKKFQSSGMTSDEDTSIAGSPSIRRRLGSGSGGPDQLSVKDETYSPDITPNGTLRRRRSRIPCEEDDGNLMDFLRTSGQDNVRERKSWGSLDRSWAKKARGQPRRGDLLNADFSADRERASSPSPQVETKPFSQEEETKPSGKAWRLKIEAWLSENEKEKRAGEDLQRRARQLQANRRSFEDSENETKSAIVNPIQEDNAMHEESLQAYDWRLSVEKSDVMRTMEAVEEAQPAVAEKDKSVWRKSNLNVQNSPEDSESRYSRRRSRLIVENMLGTSTLHAIREEERKKNKLPEGDNSDELTIYLRESCPESQAPASRRLSKLSRKSTDGESISDKIEIDSDNIETPPATRRLFSSPKEVKPVDKDSCKRERCNNVTQGRDTLKSAGSFTDLGSGNFDRYSATRRTRRYKKNPEIEKDKMDVSNHDVFDDSITSGRPSAVTVQDHQNDGGSELRSWQNRKKKQQEDNESNKDIDLAMAEIARSGEDLQQLSQTTNSSSMNLGKASRLPMTQPSPVIAVTNTVLSPVMHESRPRGSQVLFPERAVTCRERHRSMIDSSQVQEALRVADERPSQVRTEKFKNQKLKDFPKSRFVPEINKSIGRESELHDEGFEETQSLVSETMSSQDASSGNYETDVLDSSMRCSPANLTKVASNPSNFNSILEKRFSKDQNSPLSLRKMATDNSATSFLPKRTANLKRDASVSKIGDPNSTAKRILPLNLKTPVHKSLKNEVQRSNSKSSLRSSRSSLNSSSSVNTVRNLSMTNSNPAQLAGYTTAIRALTNDLRKNASGSMNGTPSLIGKDQRKVTSYGPKNLRVLGSGPVGVVRAQPASRSSSSGSSVGPLAGLQKSIPVGTIAKSRAALSSRSNNSTNIVQRGLIKRPSMEKMVLQQPGATKTRLVQPRSGGIRSRSFMKPTTASVNKGSISNIPKSMKTLVK